MEENKMGRLFPTGVPVKGKDLVGREKELKKACRLLEMGQSIVLIAPRRYGKTSLILEILERMKKDHSVGYVDIFRILTRKELAEAIVDTVLENKKLTSFVKNIRENLSHLISRVEVKQIISDYEFVMKFVQPQTQEEELLDHALDFPEAFSQKNNARLILAYDEISDLIKLNGAPLIKKMRSFFQLQERVTYIFSGSQESVMTHLFADSKQAFFRFARIMELGVLPQDALLEYITNKFSQSGLQIKAEIARQLVDKTGCHPYYTQLLCQNIYLSAEKEVRKEDVTSAYEEVILNEKSYFEEIWENLKHKRYFLEVLCFIAKGHSNPYQIPGMDRQQIYYVLCKLEEGGYIKRIAKANYELKDPLFKEFIVRQTL